MTFPIKTPNHGWGQSEMFPYSPKSSRFPGGGDRIDLKSIFGVAGAMDNEKNELFQSLNRGEITVSEYFERADKLDEIRAQQAEAEKQEELSRRIEKEILKAGGTATTRRPFGTLPNPWAGDQWSLTNQMALSRNGDPRLVDFLRGKAGIVGGDRRFAQAEKERKELERRQGWQEKIDAMRAVNQQRLGKGGTHPDFQGKVAGSAPRAWG